MGVGIVVVPKVLREKLGDDGAEALVNLLNEAKYAQKDDLEVLGERIERRILEIEKKIVEESSKLRAFVVNALGVMTGLLTLVMALLQLWAR